MRVNRNAQLDTGGVSDRRGVSGGTMAVGGGVGGLVILIIALITGVNFGGTGTQSAAPPVSNAAGNLSSCRTGADVETNPDCRFTAYVTSIQNYWTSYFQRAGQQYTPSQTVVFSGQTQSGCGTASAQVGPFYCPSDKLVYLDIAFFTELQQKFGGSGGDFAEAYVIAHEYGHHIQDLTGQMNKVTPGQGPQSGSVRLELQADCYAGAWAKNAASTPDASGQPLLQDITTQDINEGLDAANVVGDDYIQEKFSGQVSPETFTHGTSAQRKKWFATGFRTGEPGSCDTFSGGI